MILRLPNHLLGRLGDVEGYQLLPLVGNGQKTNIVGTGPLSDAEQRRQRIHTLSKRALVLGISCLLCIAVLLRVSKRTLTFEEEAFSNAVKVTEQPLDKSAGDSSAVPLSAAPSQTSAMPTSLGGVPLIPPPRPTSPLPPATDNVYGQSTPDFETYISELRDFTRLEFPSWHADAVLALLDAHLGFENTSTSSHASGNAEEGRIGTKRNGTAQTSHSNSSALSTQIPKNFWQTDKRKRQRISWGFENLNEGQGWTFSMLHDDDIASWILQNLGQPDKVVSAGLNATFSDNYSKADAPPARKSTSSRSSTAEPSPSPSGTTNGLRQIWDRINQPILHADLWRYLILTLPTYGGIYSDSDTQCLKPFSAWGRNATFWAVSNLSARQVTRPPSVILAVEADVGSNQEWFKWWARPLQFVQWTMGSAPGHPIFIDLLRRIKLSSLAYRDAKLEQQRKINMLRAEAGSLQAKLDFVSAKSGHSMTRVASVKTRLARSPTSTAAPKPERREWLQDWLSLESTRTIANFESTSASSSTSSTSSRPRPTDASLLPIFEKIESLLAEAALLESTPLVNSDTQGELSIMELTGPGVWTDSVVNYLKVRYGLDWTHFKDLEHPVRIGELAILPRTAFSPGVNTPGFGSTWDDEAMVYHEFRGTWRVSAKPEPEPPAPDDASASSSSASAAQSSNASSATDAGGKAPEDDPSWS